MADTSTFRYRAFLSYSHRNREVGDKLHKELENYRIPRELIGNPAAFGPVPQKLRPIFRDRYDLEAGHSLREQIIDAVKSSESLIVICSPASATSLYVNEEIRLFKALGRSNRIYPIIVEGEPGDPERECFPINLRRRIGTDGIVTDEAEEPIAADMRQHGDGEALATLKLIAGLLGVDIDELRRREDSERRRRQRRYAVFASLMTVLAILAVGFAGYSQVLNGRLERALASETAAREEAQARYEQALTSTLRLVTIAATFRSLTDGTSFQTSQVAEKGASDEFQTFLESSPRRDEIWFRLVQVLMNFERNLPPELRRYSQKLEEQQMRLQWAEHAEIIMTNLIRRGADKPQYREQLETIRSEILRLGGRPR